MKQEKNWYQVVFYFLCDKKKDMYNVVDIDSSAHLLVADELFRGIVKKHGLHIYPWRFHRNFVKLLDHDWPSLSESNQFKFKFYSSKTMAEKIRKTVDEYYFKDELYDDDILEDIKWTKCFGDDEVKDDNDDEWPLLIKEIWPYYICGVSHAWLKAIEQASIDVCYDIPLSDLKDMGVFDKLNLYEKIGGEIKRKWMKWANHALFHHAGVLFGNHPIDYIWYTENIKINRGKSKVTKKKYVSGEVRF